jgi:iron complex outermembrane receptor protein
VSLWATYQPGGALRGADFGTGFFYKGDFYGSDDNAPGGLVEADYTLDAAAGYEWGPYRAQLNVTNLTDQRSFLGGFGLWEPLWPRRMVLTLSTRF